MPSVIRFAPLVPQPWANGRGETTEIVRVPSAGDLRWRISVATIADDAPFSVLPGVGRSLMTLADDGLELFVDGTSVHLMRFGVAEFAGGADVHARGVVAASRDLNVMYAAGTLTGELAAVEVNGRFTVDPGGGGGGGGGGSDGAAVVVVVLEGRLSVVGAGAGAGSGPVGGTDPLGELDAVVLSGESCLFDGHATVAVATIRPLG